MLPPAPPARPLFMSLKAGSRISRDSPVEGLISSGLIQSSRGPPTVLESVSSGVGSGSDSHPVSKKAQRLRLTR